MKKTMVIINYQKISKGNLSLKSLGHSFKEYLEDEEKIKLPTFENDLENFAKYQSNKNKMIDSLLVENGYWFGKNKEVKNYEDYLKKLRQEITNDNEVKNYYGVISFTPDQLKLMGIDRYDMNKKDVTYLQKIINDSLGMLGREYFKADDFNHISIFHNNEEHFHAHINFSGNSPQGYDQVPLHYIAKMHLKIADGMFAKMNNYLVNDKDFRIKEINKEDITTYKNLLQQSKKMELKDFRYQFLEPELKKVFNDIFDNHLSNIYKEEFELLKKQYGNFYNEYIEVDFQFNNDKLKKEYQEQVKNYLNGKYQNELNKKRTIVLNRFLKDVKEYKKDNHSLDDYIIEDSTSSSNKKESDYLSTTVLDDELKIESDNKKIIFPKELNTKNFDIDKKIGNSPISENLKVAYDGNVINGKNIDSLDTAFKKVQRNRIERSIINTKNFLRINIKNESRTLTARDLEVLKRKYMNQEELEKLNNPTL